MYLCISISDAACMQEDVDALCDPTNDCPDDYVSKTFPSGKKLCMGEDCKCCVHEDQGGSISKSPR